MHSLMQHRDSHMKDVRPMNSQVSGPNLRALRNIEGKDEAHKAFWKFGRVFTDGESSLLETMTSDDEFMQEFYITVLPRDGGTLLRLGKTSRAFLTPAVRAALSDAAKRLTHEGC